MMLIVSRRRRNIYAELKHCLNPHKQKSIVRVICDRFIIGTETIHYLSMNNIIAHERRLSVESYERYYDTKLKPQVRSQYMINDRDFKHLLLSL
jgi:RecA-family ATPase